MMAASSDFIDPALSDSKLRSTTTAGTMSSHLVRDKWLEERLNRPAFTLPVDAPVECEPHSGAAFIQTKVPITDSTRADRLIRVGYSLVETAVVLEKAIKPAPPHVGVRFARPDDETSVRRIAGSVFRFSRFHMDPAIPLDAANRIKEDWAGNFFSGSRGTHMVVQEDAGAVVGFLLLIIQNDTLIIDLVGVSAGAQGRGYGRSMIDFAANNIDGPHRFLVGTQLCNVPSLAYYNGHGFRVVDARYSLHRHID